MCVGEAGCYRAIVPGVVTVKHYVERDGKSSVQASVVLQVINHAVHNGLIVFAGWCVAL